MKIIIISELAYDSGAAIAAFRLAKSLAALHNDVYYVVGQPSSKTENIPNLKTYLLRQNDKEDLRHKIFNKIYYLIERFLVLITSKNSKNRQILDFFRKRKPDNAFKLKIKNYENQLQRIIKEVKPDIINLHNISSMMNYQSILSLSSQYNIVWTLHDCWAITGYNYKFINLKKQEVTTHSIAPNLVDIQSRKTLMDSSCNLNFICPSRWLANLAVDELQGKKPVHLIANGLSATEFFPEDQRQSRLELGLDPEKFYVLLVASNLKYERKNTQIVLENIARIKDLSIEIIALGKFEQKYHQKSPSIHLFEHTFNFKTIRQLYAAADIVLIPSLIDNLPNTVLESLFCGTPVLGSNVGGIPDMVVEGKTGWLFDPYSGDDLITVLNHIYQERDQLPQMGQQCLTWVQKNYSIEQQVEAYLQLFQTIITTPESLIDSSLKLTN